MKNKKDEEETEDSRDTGQTCWNKILEEFGRTDSKAQVPACTLRSSDPEGELLSAVEKAELQSTPNRLF